MLLSSVLAHDNLGKIALVLKRTFNDS
jgi:hypothetical protein